MNQYLTTPQAADLLNLQTGTVTVYIRTGKIKAVQQPNGFYLIEAAEVERYQQQRRKRGRPKQDQLTAKKQP